MGDVLTGLNEEARRRRGSPQKLGVLLLLPRVIAQQSGQRGALLQLGGVEVAVLMCDFVIASAFDLFVVGTG